MDCGLVGNGFFEARFSEETGVQQALSRIHYYDGKEVQLYPWNADFSPETPTAAASLLESPVWL